MSVIICSTKIMYENGVCSTDVATSLKNIAAKQQHSVYMVSNHSKPTWFDTHFSGSSVKFLQELGRQKGIIINSIVDAETSTIFDVIVLAYSKIDVQMGTNGNALIIGASWSNEDYVRNLGISSGTPADFEKIVDTISSWDNLWWHHVDFCSYTVSSLSNLSGYNQSQPQSDFSARITKVVKNGGNKLNSLLAITARSLLKDNITNIEKTMWGIYPSSSSTNNDTDVLSEFSHRLRTATTRARHAKRDEPLFIRHSASPKRSKGASTGRSIPNNQIETIHINPFYKKSLKDKNVILLDDCTTYGVSFGVAAALLLKGGAKSVKTIALGKFGNCLNGYDIDIHSDPFSPIPSTGYTFNGLISSPGISYQANQNSLINIL
ncbi:phosphoribosyltransferase [Cobetia marina]